MSLSVVLDVTILSHSGVLIAGHHYISGILQLTGRRSRSWRSRIFSKIIPNRRGSVDSHTIWGLDASSTLYASTTLLLCVRETKKLCI